MRLNTRPARMEGKEREEGREGGREGGGRSKSIRVGLRVRRHREENE